MLILYVKLFFLGVIISISCIVQSEEVDRGKLLYENHCGACHTAKVHERENRKVNSLVELSKMTIQWQYHLKLNWSIDEVRQVTKFLNERYYHFDSQP